LQEADIITIPPGEESKSLEIAEGIWQTLLDNEADRQCILINVGGGVVSDLGGFVASVYKRGIRFVNIPTSLMAMTDAAIGGKTGVNLSQVKNVLGTFHNPESVLICPAFLDTLPREEVVSGMAEMLKHGLIANPELWANLSSSDVSALKMLVSLSSEIKKEIVAKDPLEKNSRKLLNFGHTIGHALESWLLEKGRPISHGHAVALGIYVESHLSVQICGLDLEAFHEIETRIKKHYSIVPVSKSELPSITGFLKNDKKNTAGNYQFVLLQKIGKAIIDVPVSQSQVESAITACLVSKA
jgi:3-dehydroquinate synthase